MSTWPALATVQVTSRPTGTSRTANANGTMPGRKTVGWPWSAGAGATWFPEPTGMITSSRLRFA